MSLTTLKEHISNIDRCFVSDRPRVDEVLKPDSLAGRVEKIREAEDQLIRIRKCRTAPDVFREFAVDAAGAKVEEMFLGKTSSSRQRAQETVLEYALGTPIRRSASMSLNVSEMPEGEIENEIKELMGELGFARFEGKTSRLLIGPQRIKRPVEVIDHISSSGGSGELCEVDGPDPLSPRREPSG